MIAGKPTVHGFFEKKTCTWQYLVGDPTTLTAAIIDPVLDYDASTQVITTHTADSILALVKELGYKVEMVLETHIHADHLSAASYLQNRLCRSEGYEPFIGVGKAHWKKCRRFLVKDMESQNENTNVLLKKLFDDDETFSIGELRATAIHLPGHTPDHLGYQIGVSAIMLTTSAMT
jgi:Zn-dependent hydrolases, including glyoxylases